MTAHLTLSENPQDPARTAAELRWCDLVYQASRRHEALRLACLALRLERPEPTA